MLATLYNSQFREGGERAMVIPVADDVGFWCERALNTRAAAKGMPDQECRNGVLAIAASYDRMAGMAQARLARHATTRRARLTLNLAAPIGGGLGLALAFAMGLL